MLPTSDIVDRMHTIVANIENVHAVPRTDGMKSLLEVYAAARDMEARNRDHYLRLAEVCPTAESMAKSPPMPGSNRGMLPRRWGG